MKTKKWLVLVMAVLCMACAIGCGKGEESGNSDTAVVLQETFGGAGEGENESALPESGSPDSKKPSDQKESNVTGELPEGYVYDYQVSLEPIPQEIADLGGPCVGTMHAFPSRIMAGLMKQRMEEDPEFKAEAEQKAEEVRKCLEEETGGEFEVEPMEADNIGWEFLCKELETGYVFQISYITVINAYEYYRDIDAQKYEEDVVNIISEIYDGSCQRIQIDRKLDLLYVWIADFKEEDINYEEEQGKILELWKRLRGYNESLCYSVNINFFPKGCEEIVNQRYEEGTVRDLNGGFSKNKPVLKMKGEIKDSFYYDEAFGEREGRLNLDKHLEEYGNGTYDENQKWEYWIQGGNN